MEPKWNLAAVKEFFPTNHIFVTVPSPTKPDVLCSYQLLSFTDVGVVVQVPHNHQENIKPHQRCYPVAQVAGFTTGASRKPTWLEALAEQRIATKPDLDKALLKFFATNSMDNLYVASMTPATIPNLYDIWFVTVVPMVENPVQWELVYYADTGSLLEKVGGKTATLHINWSEKTGEYLVDVTEPNGSTGQAEGKHRTRKLESFMLWSQASNYAYNYALSMVVEKGWITVIHDHTSFLD